MWGYSFTEEVERSVLKMKEIVASQIDHVETGFVPYTFYFNTADWAASIW